MKTVLFDLGTVTCAWQPLRQEGTRMREESLPRPPAAPPPPRTVDPALQAYFTQAGELAQAHTHSSAGTSRISLGLLELRGRSANWHQISA